MTEFLQNFHFLRPWLLLFLFLPFFLYLKKIKTGGSSSSWEDICDKNLLNFLLINGSSSKKVSVKKFIYTGLVVATLAAAGPVWNKTEIPTFTIENPNMLVVSLAQDMQLTDIPPSRLDRAKFMMSDIIKGLAQGQFGLEVYSQEPYVITPITDDSQIIQNLMPQIVPSIVPDAGDRLDRAIDLALERFKSAQYAQGNIIIFAADVGQRFDLALEKTKAARALNYTVNVIDCSYTGNEKLKLLAEAGNGVYLSVKSGNIQTLIKKISDTTEERVKLSQNLRSNYIDYGYYLLIIPLLCVLMFFRRGLLVLTLCCFAFSAQAGFLTNNNQDGLRLFNSGQYENALKKFTDHNWRGITLYKQNKNEDALKEFQKTNSDISFYNQGVILTKLCQYQEALKAFEKAVQLNPENKDAQYNKKVLDDLFEQAKTNPDVLNCNNDQQQQQQNDTKNNDNEDDNSQQNEEQKQSDQNNEQNENQSQDAQSGEQNANADNNEEQPNQQQEQNQDSENNKDNSEQNSGNNYNNSQQDEDNSAPSNQDTSGENSEKTNDKSSANQDEGPESDSQNKDGDQSGGNEEQKQEQNVNLANAKQGDDNEKYDEEALAMQRRYREIPEDVGGLLREFIKKEYLKDRYGNEN